jgi:hypothetical protein
VAARVEEVRDRIAAAAVRSGRHAGDVRLVAVSKGIGPGPLLDALGAGVGDFGESKAQELLAKAASVPGAARGPEGVPLISWHFVGRIQRNKVAAVAPLVSLWQSVDRIETGVEIARRAPGAAVLVQVNTSGEPQKGGCRPDGAAPLRVALEELGLEVRGLMAVPDLAADPRAEFAALAGLAARLGLRELSMGMTHDFEIAVEEGATMVRVGRGLFGPRIDPSSLQR